MPDNQAPWIEIKQSSQHTKVPQYASNQKYPWQAMFACQIGIRSFEERVQLKWGFNAAVLLEEALDRQKLFLESQLHNNPIDTPIEQRTLSLRCIGAPEAGLLLGLVGKVLAESPENAKTFALNYLREIESIFPYDYTIRPVTSMEAFNRTMGKEIFRKCNDQTSIAQIRRFESPLQTSKGVFRMVGIWQTGKRADEQIWRALAHYPQDILLDISICPTTLLEGERQALLEMKQVAKTHQDASSKEPYLQHYDAWIDPFVSRHISPWNKYFYLQVHLASPGRIDEYLLRSIGSSITRDNPERSTPGFQVLRPMNKSEAIEWIGHLECLDMVRTNNSLLLPRLSELASIDEVHAVFRLPYPPEPGLPNINFLEE
ncbi:MAG: hypothetical protein ACOYYU_12725 [Chloroflexota bacterium]